MKIAVDDLMPLQNLEAEMSTLGAMILKAEAIDEASFLRPHDFHFPAHQTIYAAIQSLTQKNTAIDLLTVKNELLARGELAQIGGDDYLIQVAEAVPSAANALHYAKIVLDKATLRRLNEAAHEILKIVQEPELGSDEKLEKAEQKVYEVRPHLRDGTVHHAKALARRLVQQVDDLIENGQPSLGIQTGLYDLDSMTTGLYPGSLNILAGRPSMGKTALALKIALNVARKEPGTVLYFSEEMTGDQLIKRFAAMIAQLNQGVLKQSDMTSETYRRLTDACELLYDLPIVVDDASAPTLFELRAECRRQSRKGGLSLVVVDHLGLITSMNRRENRVQQIGEITAGLKALSKDFGVPVLALSQLNRSVESRDNKRPNLSDLRDSGNIEQDADLVMFVYRDDYYKARENPDEANTDPDRTEIAELILAKHRDGPIGTIKLGFQPTYANFENLRL